MSRDRFVDCGSSIIQWVMSPLRATYSINGNHIDANRNGTNHVEVKRRRRIPGGVEITFENGSKYRVTVEKIS